MFQNAADGLKKMYIAQLATIFCAIFAVLPLIGLIGVFGILVCSILSLIGLNSAGKDIEGCKMAFTLTVVRIVVGVLSNLFGTGIMATIFSVVNDVLALLITRAVCLSVAEVMESLNRQDVADTGRSVWKINLGCYVADIVLTILAVIPVLGTVMAVAGSVVTVILGLVAGIMYIIFLSKSYQALEN